MDKAKDFEKGFEEYKAEKKQEIEELEKDISKDLQGVLETEIKSLARVLNKLGYRKIPENAVVLTEEELTERDYERYNLGYETHRQESQKREDYIETLSHHINDLEKALLIARKETAKKGAKMAKNKAIRQQEFVGELAIGDIEYVKVKDIDEIAKQITDKGVQNGN